MASRMRRIGDDNEVIAMNSRAVGNSLDYRARLLQRELLGCEIDLVFRAADHANAKRAGVRHLDDVANSILPETAERRHEDFITTSGVNCQAPARDPFGSSKSRNANRFRSTISCSSPGERGSSSAANDPSVAVYIPRMMRDLPSMFSRLAR